MFVTTDYCKTLSANVLKPCKTLADVGLSFEFEVNRHLLNMDEFVLYWDIDLYIKKEMKWALCGDFFTSDSSDTVLGISNKKQIDHVLVTPNVVFVFDSKYYSSKVSYTRSNGKLYKSGGDEVSDPSAQAGLYGAIFRQILRYYDVDLPVVSAGVLKQALNIKNGTMDDDLVVIDVLLDFIIKHTKQHPRKPMDAIKLCKSLYFDRCHPIAYDGDIAKW